MRRILVLLTGIYLLYGSLYGQSNYALTGVVVNENNQALPGATVFLYPVRKGAMTDVQGNFTLDGLKSGLYKIEISFMGYKPVVDTIRISGPRFHHVWLGCQPWTGITCETRREKSRT